MNCLSFDGNFKLKGQMFVYNMHSLDVMRYVSVVTVYKYPYELHKGMARVSV